MPIAHSSLSSLVFLFVQIAAGGQANVQATAQADGNYTSGSADSLNNLASAWQKAGQYAEAEPLYREALAGRE